MVNTLRTILFYALLYASLPVFLMTTNPDSLPLPLLIVPFLLVFAVIAGTTLLILKLLLRREGWFERRPVFFASVIALIPTVLFVLQSLHQLSPKDVLITALLVLGLSFYLVRLGLFGPR